MTAPAYDPITTSTNYQPRLALETLFPGYALGYEDGSVEIRRDYLAQLVRKLKRVSRYTPYTYQGYEVLTTLCYQSYGTTTAVHLVLMYNSISHRLELIPGQVIKFPDLSSLLQQTPTQPSQNQNSNVGKQILL